MILPYFLVAPVGYILLVIFSVCLFNNTNPAFLTKFFYILLYERLLENMKSAGRNAFLVFRFIYFNIILFLFILMLDVLKIRYLSFHQLYSTMKLNNVFPNGHLVFLFMCGYLLMFLNPEIVFCYSNKFKFKWCTKPAKSITNIKQNWKFILARLIVFTVGLALIFLSIICVNKTLM